MVSALVFSIRGEKFVVNQSMRSQILLLKTFSLAPTHFFKQIIAYPMYYRIRRFPASQDDKYRDEIKQRKNLINFNVSFLFSNCEAGQRN